VAHTLLTFPGDAIWTGFYLYAESGGRTLGDTIQELYPAVEPVKIDVTIIPDTVSPDYGTMTITARLYDGGNHSIIGQPLTFTTGNTTYTGFGALGTPSTIAITNNNGLAQADLVIGGGVPSILNNKAIITVSIGQYSGTATLTILTAP
jgi:hypothetical protein